MTNRLVTVCAILAVTCACGGSSGSSSPTTPTPAATTAPTPTPTPTPAPTPTTLSLAGSWSGTLVPVGGTTPEPVTWVATQTGTSVTGPLTITFNQNRGTGTATLSGTLNGSSLAVNYSLSNRPGAPAGCTESGTGTAASVTANSITVDIQRTYTAACASAVPSLTPTPDRLVLSK